MQKCHTERGKVEQRWEIFAVGQSRLWVPELVKEGVDHGLDRCEPSGWRVFQKTGNQLQCLWRGPGPEDFVEGVGFDLGELVLHVIGIHCLDLLPRRCSKYFDNLHKLINATLAREQGLSKHQLGHDTSSRPDIYFVELNKPQRQYPCSFHGRQNVNLLFGQWGWDSPMLVV